MSLCRGMLVVHIPLCQRDVIRIRRCRKSIFHRITVAWSHLRDIKWNMSLIFRLNVFTLPNLIEDFSVMRVIHLFHAFELYLRLIF